MMGNSVSVGLPAAEAGVGLPGLASAVGMFVPSTFGANSITPGEFSRRVSLAKSLLFKALNADGVTGLDLLRLPVSGTGNWINSYGEIVTEDVTLVFTLASISESQWRALVDGALFLGRIWGQEVIGLVGPYGPLWLDVSIGSAGEYSPAISTSEVIQ